MVGRPPAVDDLMANMPAGLARLRRCAAVGQCINFHTDVSLRTMQVALTGPESCTFFLVEIEAFLAGRQCEHARIGRMSQRVTNVINKSSLFLDIF